MTPRGSGPVQRTVREFAAREPDDECWIFPRAFHRSHNGYPQVRWDGRTRRAAHVVLELVGRPRPSRDAQIRHSCHRPACVNPSHLRWGTAQENIADKVAAGRQALGESVSTAKLKASDVREIRASSETRRVLAERYGVTEANIGCIVRGETWRHL